MSTPLTTQPADKVALLPPQLFGSVAYYAAMAQYRKAVVDTSLRYDKRFKSVHRYSIADARGELRLTVPVSRPEGAFLAGNLTWRDVTVSAHGRWWEVHLQALESAYGRTPFSNSTSTVSPPCSRPRAEHMLNGARGRCYYS